MLGIIFALLAFIAAGVLAINNHENLSVVDGTTTSRHADACKANAVLLDKVGELQAAVETLLTKLEASVVHRKLVPADAESQPPHLLW